MNKRNTGSKESVGVKYKNGICAELCLKLWFESDWYFWNITDSGWFWKRLSRNKVPNNHFVKSSEAAVRRCSFFNKVARLKVCTFMKRRLQHVFSCECCKIFENSIFNLRWLLLSVSTVQYWTSVDLLFVIKNTMWDGFY